MHKTLIIIFLIFHSLNSNAHIPVLLMPLEGPQVASYFLTQSSVSRAVYSELTKSQDIFSVQFNVKSDENTLLQVFTPVCPKLPHYEAFQPTAFVIAGDLPWRRQDESHVEFIKRLLKNAVAIAKSDYTIGKRPQFHEEFANVDYWKGGEWSGRLAQGLYTIVVYSPNANKGVFLLGLNEKETWNDDLYAYVKKLIPKVKKGLCDPRGFTGKLSFIEK